MNQRPYRLVHEFLERSALRYPEKTALVHREIRASYGELNIAANRLAEWCRISGVKKGDRVVLLMENSVEYVVAYYGVLKAGAAVVPLNSDATPDKIRPLIGSADPTLIVASRRSERLLKEVSPQNPALRGCVVTAPSLSWSDAPFIVTAWDEMASGSGMANPDRLSDDSQLASILFTSGSSGTPKGVMLSHRNIVANVDSICRSLSLTDSDVQLIVLPFHYVMGKSLLNTHFAVGGTVIINNTVAYPASAVMDMACESVTGFSGVPSTYAFLIHRSPLREYRDRLPSLRYCSQAGGHMSRHTTARLREVLPAHTDIVVMYGATEAAARLTCLEPDRLKDKIDSIGTPVFGVKIRVLGPDGEVVPPTCEGELVASGENIMLGYWKDPEATARALGKYGYRTGDLGFQDEDGYLYITGRRDNQLKVSGHRINPIEVEDAILDTERVEEVAVIGVPDELRGRLLTALVVPVDSDLSEDELLRECAPRLPRYKLPTRVRFLRSLPKMASGKIDLEQCRVLAEGQ